MLHKTKKHFFHTMQHQLYNERPALRTDQHYRASTSIQSENSLKNVALHHYTQLFVILSTLCTFADYSLNINSFKSVDKYKIHLHHYLHYLHERVQSGTTLSPHPLHIQMQIGSLTHLLYQTDSLFISHTHKSVTPPAFYDIGRADFLSEQPKFRSPYTVKREWQCRQKQVVVQANFTVIYTR